MRFLPSTLVTLALCFQALWAQETTTTTPEICRSKTINYITHTLPQQCLRTNWSSANSTEQNSNATVTGTDPVVETGAKTEPVVPAETGTQGTGSLEQGGKEAKKEDGSSEGRAAKEGEDDPEDLATGSFMSFEEWKAMMLQKSGQDLADLKGRKYNKEGRDGAEVGSNDGLDSWGDDGEIALDFDVLSGKISEMTATAGARGGSASGDVANAETQEPAAKDDGEVHYSRPRDAGKTCKERFSYSSFDGGATVLKTSHGAKNAKAILVENKDSYMLFTCSQENKFVIVELSEDILVDTVVLANFEFFSSMIRSFRISVSDKYPVKMEKWKDVGTFQARNSRDIQAFLIENPKIWAKYIRIEFLSHYGNEYYCPVSLLRVHGTRMLDSWKEAEAGADDDEPAETISGPEPVPEHELSQENTTIAEPEAINTVEHTEPVVSDELVKDYGHSPWYAPLYSEPSLQTCGIATPTTTHTVEMSPPAHAGNASTPPIEPVPSTKDSSESATVGNETVSFATVPGPSTYTSSSSTDASASISVSSTSEVPASSTDSTTNKTQTIQPPVKSSVTPPKPPPGSKPGDSSSSKSSSKYGAKQPTNTNQNKTTTGTSSSANASPTVQESFFKSISKRLQFLETNTTLSLQYIEDQSKFIQEALQKMERRQVFRVDAFLDNLNNTVLSELRSVRQQYDQIWQSTVLALETQREQSDREIIALSSRLNLLADEVVFQKRMAIFQSVLLLCCLVLVLFSRGVLGGSSVGEQWHMTSSQFFNSYLGSPRWAPGSPRYTSREHTPTRRASDGSVKHAGRGLHPGNIQRSVSGPIPQHGQRTAPPSHAMSYADKVLPLTPRSEVFDDGNESGNGSSTPPPSSRRGPTIRVDEPDVYYDSPEHNEDSDDFIAGKQKSIEDSPTSGEESSSSVDTLMDRREASPDDDDDDDEVDGNAGGCLGVDQPSKPPLTRSPLSELCGISRKPLPALPEDPI